MPGDSTDVGPVQSPNVRQPCDLGLDTSPLGASLSWSVKRESSLLPCLPCLVEGQIIFFFF